MIIAAALFVGQDPVPWGRWRRDRLRRDGQLAIAMPTVICRP